MHLWGLPSFVGKSSSNLHNRRKSSSVTAIDVRSASPPIITTPSEYSDYGKIGDMDINEASSISEIGPRSPIFTLESLHDIEELMGIEEITVSQKHVRLLNSLIKFYIFYYDGNNG